MKNKNQLMKKITKTTAQFTCLTLIVITCGCQSMTYVAPNGERFTRVSVAARTSITSILVETGSNGLRRVELRGYRNDSSQTLATVTEAAVRGAVQAAK